MDPFAIKRLAYVAVLSLVGLLPRSSSAQQGASFNPIAQAIANRIVTVYSQHVPLNPCHNAIFMIAPDKVTENTLLAARKGDTPIEIQFKPVPFSELPASVADILNRLQQGGGTVSMWYKQGHEAVASGVLYVADDALKALSEAASSLVSSITDEWAAAGLGRYSATLLLTRDATHSALVYHITLRCQMPH